MIDRACISINNRCNLDCEYCHFHAPEKLSYLADTEMNVFAVLDRITEHIDRHCLKIFKLGFVGNGEPLIDFDRLSGYIKHIEGYISDGKIAAYTITNGTLITEEMLRFFKEYGVSVGISVDGPAEIHNKYRCDSHEAVLRAVEIYREVNGRYPPMNCTVSRDILDRAEETIAFFKRFGSRITFSRMIGKNGISLHEFRHFLECAGQRLRVRAGGYDCTMYGGMCGAGINNIFYANGKIYLCGNCVDLPSLGGYDTPLDGIAADVGEFDRGCCYKEELLRNTLKGRGERL